MITVRLSARDARTLILAIDHLIGGCINTGASTYGIDVFCRNCAERLTAIKNDIVSAFPSKPKD